MISTLVASKSSASKENPSTGANISLNKPRLGNNLLKALKAQSIFHFLRKGQHTGHVT